MLCTLTGHFKRATVDLPYLVFELAYIWYSRSSCHEALQCVGLAMALTYLAIRVTPKQCCSLHGSVRVAWSRGLATLVKVA